MLVKQLCFTNFVVDKLLFKGWVVKKNNVILNAPFTVIKAPVPVSGSINNFILSDVDFLSLSNIEFNATQLLNEEIIIDFTNEIEIDNIQCVCGPNLSNHFKSLIIYYKTLNGKWELFTDTKLIPTFKENSISDTRNRKVQVVNKTRDLVYSPRNNDSITTKVNSGYSYILRSKDTIKTGKHFVEVSLLNTIRNLGSYWGIPISLLEANSVFNSFTNTNVKGYTVDSSTTGQELRRLTGSSNTLLERTATGYPNATNWPEQTIGLFIDLDLNKIKIIVNGIFETGWYTIEKSKPDQEFYLVTQIRDLGINSEFNYNYPHKYQYAELDNTYKQDHFLHDEGWVSIDYYVTLKKPNQHYIDWPYGASQLRYLDELPGIQYVTCTAGIYIPANIQDTVIGYGYFKSTVHIDYPPKEPISKRVCLFQIRENKVIQQVWSNPINGQYEFKNIMLKEPYLIFTYDSDEDHNAVIVGPVYPTLMPEFEGMDLTLIPTF